MRVFSPLPRRALEALATDVSKRVPAWGAHTDTLQWTHLRGLASHAKVGLASTASTGTST